MEHIVRSLKVFWRSERLVRQNDLRLATQKILFLALAGLVAVFGLVMLSISVFFALVPHFGRGHSCIDRRWSRYHHCSDIGTLCTSYQTG